MPRKFTDNGFLTMGYECEFTGLSQNETERELISNGLDFVWVTRDVSCGTEVVFPPLPIYERSFDFIRKVYECLENAGARINTNCGHHVHISNRMVINASKDEFFEDATNRAHSTEYHSDSDRKYPSGDLFGDIMPFQLVKDVVYRYGINQSEINRMLAPSRSNNTHCQTIERNVITDEFRNSTSILELQNAVQTDGGKFWAVNFHGWQSKNTIEFRQHQGTLSKDKISAWTKLIENLFVWSDNERLHYEQTDELPEMPFRPTSRNGVAWRMCYDDNGASVQELMDAIGWNPNNVRRTISEWRTRFGDNSVQTISQQNNGAHYGDGETFTKYVLNKNGSAIITLLPENRAGQTSIYAGLDDDIFEYIQQRIQELSQR